MKVVLVAAICFLLSAAVRLLAFSHCVSKAGYQHLDSQCQAYCADGRCPDFCKCIAGNATETCAKLDFGPNNSLAVNETVKPGTPIFTIQITGQEWWSYTLGRGGPVDGSVWNSLSNYLKLTKIGNRYEMIVDLTPDLEDIFQRYGVKLASLTLVLACERTGFPKKENKVLLHILPVNEHAPEFFIMPLKTRVPENTKVGTVIYRLSDHTLDLDVNPTTNELASFGMREYLPDTKKDGRAYFKMVDTQKGSIQVKAELDFEVLQQLDAVRFYLNVSASDVHGVTAFTTLTVDIENVDDLPPGFHDPSCMVSQKSKPCIDSYQARVPWRFQGQIINIIPGLIQARDMDGLNTTVIYSLAKAQGETLENLNKFDINETTGRLFLISPFEERGEVDLVIEAREVSPNARFSQIPLHVTVDDFGDTLGLGKFDSSYRPGSNNTSVSTQSSVDLFMVASFVQSLFVLLLLITLVLCAKLKTRSRQAATVQPSEVPDKPAEVPSHHYPKDIECQSPSTCAASAASASNIEGVTEEKSYAELVKTGLFNDQNQQNIISELPSMIPFAPSAYNNWIRNYPHDRNMQISASPVSSIELERTISLTVSNPPVTGGRMGAMTFSDCPNTGCSHCGRVALSNYANIMRTNILAVSNSSYTGKLLIVSDPSLNKDNYKGILDGCNPELPYEHRKGYVAARSETESTNSDKVRTLMNRNVIHKVSNTRMPHDANFSTQDMDKKRDTEMAPEFSNRLFLLPDMQNKKHVRESSDDCRPTDKESDDGYKNGNSISEDNTGSCSERMSATPRQSYRDVSSPVGVSARSKGDGRITKSSLSVAVQHTHNTPLPQVETTAILARAQQQEGLIKSANNLNNEKEANVDVNTTEEENMAQYCLEKVTKSQSITIPNIPQTLMNKTETVEHASDIVAPTPSMFKTETMVTNKIQSDTRNETKQSEVVKDLRSVIVGRPMASSMSSDRSKSKYSGREASSTEQSSQIATASNSFPHGSFAGSKSRPHTSDGAINDNKTFSSVVVPRASTSAPTRRKRRTKRRRELDEVTFRRTDRIDKHIPQRSADISHSGCEPQRNLAPNVDALNMGLQHRLQQLHPWSLSNVSMSNKHQRQPELLQVQNHECLLPYDQANYWQPEYQQVYVGRLQREQPYILLRQQEPPQCNHRMQQQHQRLPTLPEVVNLHFHHPDGQVVTTHDGNNTCEDDAKPQRPGKKDKDKKSLEDTE